MKLSAQEEYGLRCLLALARADGPLTIPEIARAERIAEPNTAKLLRILRRAGLVSAHRGHTGGYSLSRPAAEMNLGEVLSTLGGRIFDSAFCEKHAGGAPRPTSPGRCAHSRDCSVRSVWQLVQSAVDDVLGRVSLADLLVEEQGFRSKFTARQAIRRRQLPVVEITA
jgi:Rrf2 family protein